MSGSSSIAITTVVFLLVAPPAHAQSAPAAPVNPRDVPQTTALVADSSATPPVVGEAAGAAAAASLADRIVAIHSRAALVKATERTRADAKFESLCQKIDGEGEVCCETRIASRIAGEYNVPAEDLIRERALLGCGWGDLIVARTLIANSDQPPTHAELFAIHSAGLGWGEIAAGLGFHLDDLLHAVKAEIRVARGTSPADGRVAVVRARAPVPGARPIDR